MITRRHAHITSPTVINSSTTVYGVQTLRPIEREGRGGGGSRWWSTHITMCVHACIHIHIHVDAFLNTMYTYNVYSIVYIVRCIVNLHNSKKQPYALLMLNTPTATAPLLPWDEVSTWTSKACNEVSYNPVYVCLGL